MEKYRKDKKFNLYILKSKLIQKKYMKEINEQTKNTDLLYLMQKFVNRLKDIDLIYSRADIEYYKYDETFYPNSLLNDEIITRYKFCAIILGYIDANIMHFNKYKDEKEDLVKIFSFFRELILDNFNKSILNCDSKILIDIIHSNPSYINFDKLFIEISNNKYCFESELDVISSYAIGYKNYRKYNINQVYELYYKLSNELSIYKYNNKNEVQNIRKLKKDSSK